MDRDPFFNTQNDGFNDNSVFETNATFEGNSFTSGGVRPTVVKPGGDRRKKIFKILIPALCLLCAVIGGITGAVTATHVYARKAENTTSAEAGGSSAQNEPESSKSIEALYAQQSGVASGTASNTQSSSQTSDTSTAAMSARDVYKNCVNSVVYVETSSAGLRGSSTSSGSGFFVTDTGYIVTNYHVVEGGSSYKVTTYDNKEYTAELVGYEDSNDIAVLKISDGTFSGVKYGNSSSLCVGDNVYVIGNPLGDLTYTLTSGVVSALNRLIKSDDGSLINMFQTDAAVNSGNSGGPVFDSTGSVVGIATAKYASSSIEGLSFCIPINDVRSMIDDIINQGYVSGKASLGVSVYDAGYRNYAYFSIYSSSSAGAKVAAVGSGTAADKAGIKVNDIITAIDGYAIDSASTLKTYLTAFKAGDTVKLTVSRGGAKSEIEITLDEYTPSSSRTGYSNVYDL